MICRLCLIDCTETLNIFDSEGIELRIAATITQHFWFEPKIDDPISNIICNACWWKIDSFHAFYLDIEEAHKKLSERISIKQELPFSNVSVLKTENNEPALDENSTNNLLCKHEMHSTNGNIAELNSIEDFTPATEDTQSKIETKHEMEQTKYMKLPKRLTRSSYNLAAKKLLEETVKIEKIQIKSRKNSKIRKIGRTRKKLLRTSEISDESQDDNYDADVREEEEEYNNGNENEHNNDDNRGKIKLKKLKRPVEPSEYVRKSKEDDEQIARYMKLKCELCVAEFTIFAEVRRHYRISHKRKGYVICCNKKLYKRVLILDHIKKHLNPEHFKCNECNKVFSDNQCLKTHMMRHESEDVKIFKCEQCPRRYAKQYLLDYHKLIHTPQEQRQYFCDECGKAFPTNNLLQTHRRYVHENVYGQMCHICAKVIRGKTLFEKHQLEHAGITEPKVQCEQCGAWLKHAYSLRKHMRRHLEEAGEHICNLCGKVAPSKGALRSHIRYVHSSKRSFQCSICSKAFKKALALREHMTTHTGEVLYTCPHCPKTFNSSANMHSHRKKAHRKEWEEGRRNRGIGYQDLYDNSNNEIMKTVPVSDQKPHILCETSLGEIQMETTNNLIYETNPCDNIISI